MTAISTGSIRAAAPAVWATAAAGTALGVGVGVPVGYPFLLGCLLALAATQALTSLASP